MSRFLNVLRSWLVMVSIVAAGHSLQSFQDHTFLYENIYISKPDLGKEAKTCILCGSGLNGGPQTWLHITITAKTKTRQSTGGQFPVQT